MNNKKNNLPKRVVSTKSTTHQPQYNERKTSSATKFNNSRNAIKPKKTTKSDINFDKSKKATTTFRHILCSKKTDRAQVPPIQTEDNKNSGDSAKMAPTTHLQDQSSSKLSCNVTESTTKCSTLENIYHNQNFVESNDSINIMGGTKKSHLDTIKELPENRSDGFHSRFQDPDRETLESIKSFRQENYFECHSAKSRTSCTGSGVSSEHECSYSFFLNERLFPVPIKTDYNNSIRCNECYLPFDDKLNKSDTLNGTIQAKVSLGEEDTKDIVVLLPVKDNLIIKEKRKERNRKDDVVYYGIVKLHNSRCAMSNNCHSDSFALRYEKGFKVYSNAYNCKYRALNEHDIIII